MTGRVYPLRGRGEDRPFSGPKPAARRGGRATSAGPDPSTGDYSHARAARFYPAPTAHPTPPTHAGPSRPPAVRSTLLLSMGEVGGLPLHLPPLLGPEDGAALRGTAQLLYSYGLEVEQEGSELPEPETRWELVAGLAELKFLEGYFTSVFNEHRDSSLPPNVEELSRFAGGIASGLSDLAFRLNAELGKWRG